MSMGGVEASALHARTSERREDGRDFARADQVNSSLSGSSLGRAERLRGGGWSVSRKGESSASRSRSTSALSRTGSVASWNSESVMMEEEEG